MTQTLYRRARDLAARDRIAPPAHLLPLVLVAYSTLLPRELSIDVAGANIYPYRLMLLALFPFMIRQIIGNRLRPHWLDALAGFVTAWFLVSVLVNGTAVEVFTRGFANAADFGLAYLLGRVSIRKPDDIHRFFLALLPGLLSISAILAIESISHRNILRPLVAQLTGAPVPNLYHETRMGLLRASGPFPHPILGGVFLSSILPMAYFATKTPTIRWLGVLASFGVIFSLSSTAFLAFLIAGALIASSEAQRITKLPIFGLVFLALGSGLMLIGTISESGIFSFLIRQTLSPASGYYRMLIWQFAGAEVQQSPWFGIGFREWHRPDWMHSGSVDAHFLLLSMRFGLPVGVAAFFLMLCPALVALWGTRAHKGLIRSGALGISFALLTLTISAFSVALWEGVEKWTLLLSGMAVSFGSQAAIAGSKSRRETPRFTGNERGDPSGIPA